MKVLQSLLYLGLVALASACSGSDDSGDGSGDGSGKEPENGGAPNRGGGATQATSCSGLSASLRLSELSAAELESACHGYAACDAQDLVDNPVPEYCKSMAVVLTGLSGRTTTYSSDVEAQAACDANYDRCIDDPDAVSKAQALISTMLSRPCPATTAACTATIGELDRCMVKLRATTQVRVPSSCGEITLEWLVNGAGNVEELPSECEAMNDGSCIQLATGAL
ncbi:MAG: hypothetical protein QM784_32890 [Polyangiaceae bacterium]